MDVERVDEPVTGVRPPDSGESGGTTSSTRFRSMACVIAPGATGWTLRLFAPSVTSLQTLIHRGTAIDADPQVVRAHGMSPHSRTGPR